MSAEYEAQPRRIGGHYLHNIPGLTAQRLSELWQGVMHATQDINAMCDVTYLARGGLRVEVTWHQNGMRQHYPALLTAEDVASVLDVGEGTLFTVFAQQTLNSVREMRNRLAEALPTEGETPEFKASAAAVDTLIGALRAGNVASREVHAGEDKHDFCSRCRSHLTPGHMRDCAVLDCPHSQPPAGNGNTEES